jgi:uracil-DNA glycosylase
MLPASFLILLLKEEVLEIVTLQGPDQTDIGLLVGQVQEFLELQKDLGRKFLSWSKKNPKSSEPLGYHPGTHFDSLSALSQALIQCRGCPLYKERRQPVPGQGASRARLMFIGVGPGKEDDQQGYPFWGPDGQLLTKMIQAIQLTREEVYLTQVVKCRPPDDRKPTPEEIDACGFFLKEEIRLIDPGILVALGDRVAKTLSRSNKKISDLRGRWLNVEGRRLMATFHPAFLLTNPGAKREAWEDLKKVRREYDGLEP